jgi:Fe-S cluster assembly iron-binding protein IscA
LTKPRVCQNANGVAVRTAVRNVGCEIMRLTFNYSTELFDRDMTVNTVIRGADSPCAGKLRN